MYKCHPIHTSRQALLQLRTQAGIRPGAPNLSKAATSPLALLQADVRLVQGLLDEFESPANGEDRLASLTGSAQLLAITNLPLPDGYRPDYVDILIDVSRYPCSAGSDRTPHGRHYFSRGQ